MGRKAKTSSEIVALNVSLPLALKDWVEQRAFEGGYSSSSEYVRLLIRADKEARDQNARIEKMIVKASTLKGGAEDESSVAAARLKEAFDLMRLALEMAKAQTNTKPASIVMEERLNKSQRMRSSDEHPGYLKESPERMARILRRRS